MTVRKVKSDDEDSKIIAAAAAATAPQTVDEARWSEKNETNTLPLHTAALQALQGSLRVPELPIGSDWYWYCYWRG
jgi:hypothetical protein